MKNRASNDLANLYSSSKKNRNKKHMEKLFPNVLEGCINFGYWDSFDLPISLEKRLKAQKKLYEKVFSKFRANNVLEIGCGRGHGIFWLYEQNINCFGIDALSEQIDKCKKNYPFLSSHFFIGSANKIPFKDSFFDAIYTIEAAQHFYSFSKFIKESFRVLKSPGILCISTYFFTSENSKKKVLELIPPNIEGTHRAIAIDQAIKKIKSSKFKILKLEKIGGKVFPAYAAWQKQVILPKKGFKSLSTNNKWRNYYIGGGENEHPWLRCYKKGLIDYYIITAIKN
jgi:ubiquinone/menaquinone biosynthesis C-methylase UbiE